MVPAPREGDMEMTARKPATTTEQPTLVLHFEVEKDTKNTRKYAEIPNEAGVTFVGSLYVQKAAGMVLGALPEKLTVTVQAS